LYRYDSRGRLYDKPPFYVLYSNDGEVLEPDFPSDNYIQKFLYKDETGYEDEINAFGYAV
jgi:hypothetical protein